MKYNFRCTQQELYALCTFGWDNCEQNLETFANFSPKYTEAFVKKRQAEVSRISNMPDMSQRAYANESLRIELQVQLRLCLDNWQRLKRYISVAFPPNFRKTKLKGAGH